MLVGVLAAVACALAPAAAHAQAGDDNTNIRVCEGDVCEYTELGPAGFALPLLGIGPEDVACQAPTVLPIPGVGEVGICDPQPVPDPNFRRTPLIRLAALDHELELATDRTGSALFQSYAAGIRVDDTRVELYTHARLPTSARARRTACPDDGSAEPLVPADRAQGTERRCRQSEGPLGSTAAYSQEMANLAARAGVLSALAVVAFTGCDGNDGNTAPKSAMSVASPIDSRLTRCPLDRGRKATASSWSGSVAGIGCRAAGRLIQNHFLRDCVCRGKATYESIRESNPAPFRSAGFKCGSFPLEDGSGWHAICNREDAQISFFMTP